MKTRLALALAACVLPAASCLDDVPLADKTDGAVVDRPRSDASIYCPEDLDHNTAQGPDLLYPRAVVLPPPDTSATFPTTSEYEVRGRWMAPRRLATPLDRECVPSVAGDAACHPDAVIRVQPDGVVGAPVEFLVSVAFGALPSLPEGTDVVLRLTSATQIVARLSPFNVMLTLRRASDDALLLVVANLYGSEQVLSYGALHLQRSTNPVCISRPESFCRRTFGAYALEVSGVTVGRSLSPRETATFDNADGRFSVRNFLAMHRIPNPNGECADAIYDTYSFEIVRQP